MGKHRNRGRTRSGSNLSNDSTRKSITKSVKSVKNGHNRKLSTGSNGEKMTHKEALMVKYDVITQKQANNICLAELPVAFQQYQSTEKGVVAPRGLNNMGNTCFLNSTLQCLLHTIPLRNYLLPRTHSQKCKVDGY